jgi:hypothetical protein
MARRKKKNPFDSALGGAFSTRKKRGKKSPFDSALGNAFKTRKRKRRDLAGDNLAKATGLYNSRRRKKANLLENALSKDLSNNRLTRGFASSKMVKQAARSWANRLSRTEYAEEQQEIIDKLEQNPQRFADEVRANRLARVMPWLNRVAAFFIRRIKDEDK